MLRFPKIGITTGTTEAWKADGKSYDSYADAVSRAGGQSVALGPLHDGKLEDCDGLLISGGADIHPKHYSKRAEDERLSADELKEKYHMHFDEPRDEYEFSLVPRAIREGIPILAICRGFQLVNVILGGTLVPDIPTCIGEKVVHSSGKEGVGVCHDVKIIPESKLGELVTTPSLQVNSYHHQGVMPADLAPGLSAVAVAPDGLIEAFEAVDRPWLVAVQWHPERSVDACIYEACLALFDELVRQAGMRQEGKRYEP